MAGPLNRVTLAQLTGLSSGSVTNVTAALLEEGLICEVGFEESDGGRPRVMLEVNPAFGGSVGIELGETRVRVEGFDLKMRPIAAADVALHPQHHDPVLVVGEIVNAVNRVRAAFDAEGRRLLGVGVAVPGIVAYHNGAAWAHAPNIGWREVPIEEMMCDRLKVPVFAENGAKALGQAEMWLGAGRGSKHAIVALWGTGVGAAIFSNGAIHRGSASSAGEWGHTCVVVGGRRCRCGASGCIEAYIGAGALLEAWCGVDPKARRVADPDSEEWAPALLAAAQAGGPARDVLDEAATYFGVGAANLVNLFNPEKIIIGGWLGLVLGPHLLDRVRAVVKQQALEYTANRASIEVGELGPDAVALGACSLVMDELLANGGVPPTLGDVRARDQLRLS